MQLEKEQLLTAPLPRMAGKLTFMRSRTADILELTADNLSVLGIPLEKNCGENTGCRYGPLALRETSVYYGWFNNPQFKSSPVDVVTRTQIDTSSINNRLVDIGDIPIAGLQKINAEERICRTLQMLQKQECPCIILGGDETIVFPTVKGMSHNNRIGFIQIGSSTFSEKSMRRLFLEGILNPSNTIFVSPVMFHTKEFVSEFKNGGGIIISSSEMRNSYSNYSNMFYQNISRVDIVVAHMDLSALDSSIHGMVEVPNFNGLSLREIQEILIALGQIPLAALIITGLNPTINGLGIVKIGQRLLVTALLKYIYARLGLTKN